MRISEVFAPFLFLINFVGFLEYAQNNSFPAPAKFSWVIPNKLGGMRFPSSPWVLLGLGAQFNVGKVINLAGGYDERIFETLPDHEKLIEEGLLPKIVNILVEDFSPPTLEQAYQLVKEVDETLEKNKAVVIHCQAGMGRTGKFILILFYFIQKISLILMKNSNLISIIGK